MIAAAVLILCSGFVPLLVKQFDPDYTSLNCYDADYDKLLYEHMLESIERQKEAGITPEEQQLLEIYQQTVEEMLKTAAQLQVTTTELINSNDKWDTLRNCYIYKLKEAVDQLGIDSSAMDPYQIQNFFGTALPEFLHYTVYEGEGDQDWFFQEDLRRSDDFLASLSAPVDRKQNALKLLQEERDMLREQGESGGMDSDYMSYQKQQIEYLERAIRNGAYNPARWDYYWLFQYGLESEKQSLDEMEQHQADELYRPIKGSYIDPNTGELIENIDLLPFEEYEPIYLEQLNTQRMNYELIDYGTKHNIRPLDLPGMVTSKNDPRQLAIGVLPYLLLAAVLTGVLSACSVGREYTESTMGGLLTRRASRGEILLSKQLGCAVFAAALIAACGLVSAVSAGILCGPGELFTGVIFRIGNSLHSVPFWLWYAAKCGGMLCIAVLVSGVGCIGSLLSHRMWVGTACAGVCSALIGFCAFYPGYYYVKQYSKQFSVTMDLLLSSAWHGPKSQVNWFEVYERMARQLRLGWAVLLVVLGIFLLFFVTYAAFQKQEINGTPHRSGRRNPGNG